MAVQAECVGNTVPRFVECKGPRCIGVFGRGEGTARKTGRKRITGVNGSRNADSNRRRRHKFPSYTAWPKKKQMLDKISRRNRSSAENRRVDTGYMYMSGSQSVQGATEFHHRINGIHICRQKTVVKIIYLFTMFEPRLTLGSRWSAVCLELHVLVTGK